MRLGQLLGDSGVSLLWQSLPDVLGIEISKIAIDSLAVRPGTLFVALPGHRTHGAEFARQAQDAGAVAIVTDRLGCRKISETTPKISAPVMVVASPRMSVSALSASFYGYPAQALTVVGITGTNGKTSVAHLLQSVLNANGRRCGLIGTLGARYPEWEGEGLSRTTPESPDLHRILAVMSERGADCVSMEVSSIAIREERVNDVTFDTVAFTGLSQDHLDYHTTMDDYFAAKSELFREPLARRGIVVVDSKWGRKLAEIAEIPVTTLSVESDVGDWTVSRRPYGYELRGEESVVFELPVNSDFAAANAALTLLISRQQGVSLQDAVEAVTTARIPGRMESVARAGGVNFVVDYAHTPDAIERVLAAARKSRHDSGGRVIVVLGAGGDRDHAKRPLMGEAAGCYADVVIIADDNPRSEEPAEIRRQIRVGAERKTAEVHEAATRHEAIRFAVEQARSGDIVLVLGKGHETHQDFGDFLTPFDDREVLASEVQRRMDY